MWKVSLLVKVSIIAFMLSGCGSGDGTMQAPVPESVEPENVAPIVEPVNTVVIDERATISMAVKATDSDGDITSVEWSQQSGPDVTVETGESNTFFLNAPEVDREGASAVFEVIVTDDDGATTNISINVEIRNVNIPPVAEAGSDQSVRTGNGTRLSGSDSYDVDGTQLTYTWSLVAPMGSDSQLDTNNTVNVEFVPDIEGVYTAQLAVTDEDGASDIDHVEILVEAVNMAPVAAAGSDQAVNTGSDVILNGQDSYDPEGANLTYQWRLEAPDTSTAVLDDSSVMSPRFFADLDGEYQLFLVVNDGQLDSIEDSLTITASNNNVAPIANAGSDQVGSRAIEVNLDGSNSYDPNDDLLSFSWSVVSQPFNSDLVLNDSSSPIISFIPFQFGSYVLSLEVSDGEFSAIDTVVVTIVEGDIYIDDLDNENVRYGWPYTGELVLGEVSIEDDTYELGRSAFIATGADFKIKYSAVDRNGVTTAFCGELFDGQIIRAGEPVPFVCSVRVVKGQEFDVEFKIEIEGYPRRTWTYIVRGTFL